MDSWPVAFLVQTLTSCMQISLSCPRSWERVKPYPPTVGTGRTDFLLDVVLLVYYLVKIKKVVTSFLVCHSYAFYYLYTKDWLCFQVYKLWKLYDCLHMYMCVCAAVPQHWSQNAPSPQTICSRAYQQPHHLDCSPLTVVTANNHC